ncbi:MAG: hypothetical protein PUB96_00710 [Helicobacteraceae bacterium]|nr:hypothetical protein [Helicobacteraceae bacterium]
MPIDDLNYFKQYKAFVSGSNNCTKQVLVHNIKKTLSPSQISNLIKTHLEIGGIAINSVTCRLLMP